VEYAVGSGNDPVNICGFGMETFTICPCAENVTPDVTLVGSTFASVLYVAVAVAVLPRPKVEQEFDVLVEDPEILAVILPTGRFVLS
jgi:hypothetical protein